MWSRTSKTTWKWTEQSPPEKVRASVRSAVKRVLRQNGVTGNEMQAVQEQIMEQAESLYADWPTDSHLDVIQ